MIKQGVKTFLEVPHSGTLMISGAWGSGKSYFVKHVLKPYIKNIKFDEKKHATNSSLTGEILKMIQDTLDAEKGKYSPVIVSLFGKHDIKEIEKAITDRWLDEHTRGVMSKVDVLTESLKKIWDKSKKLKDWFDLSDTLDMRQKIKTSFLPKNTVIILDDLERVSDEIKEVELLGFINDLSENLGFKVILIAHEDYLNTIHKKHLDFKEKVVEKTLKFNADVAGAADSMIKELNDDDFAAFMRGEVIASSLNPKSAFAQRNINYLKELSNLRTVKFAISHFYRIFRPLVQFFREDRSSGVDENEFLKFCWFTILALSIELKNNRISCVNVRELDEFFYLDSMEIVFHPEKIEDIDDNEVDSKFDANGIPKEDAKYKRWFYEFYFKSRSCGLLPISSPELIGYVVNGTNIDMTKCVHDYVRDKLALSPKVNLADKSLERFSQGLPSMSNEEAEECLKNLADETVKGGFSELSSFINSGVYLYNFGSVLCGWSGDDIERRLKVGIDYWFDANTLDQYSKTRFRSIHGMIDPALQWVYDYINSKILTMDRQEQALAFAKLLELFSKDTGAFCVEICPEVFSAKSSYGVTYFMNHPVLNHIPEHAIIDKIKSINVSDASALAEVAKHRYNIDSDGSLLASERPFWAVISKLLESQQDIKTIGMVMARKNLYPIAKNLGEEPPMEF
ncbi:MAG: KAP family NTPase [Muribaculaceae bacterium]|nr:KAP family NTPase [Muribaculaceae bacterium]